MTHQVHGCTKSHVRTGLLALAAGSALALPHAAQAQEDPAPMLQWFECRFADMERRMPDFFMSGWGSVWLPPVSKGYISPRDANQNSFSAGYDPFDRFDLGSPGRQTAYGTEAYFDAVMTEFHRANTLVYIDMVLNHNAGRQTSLLFQQDGGYPGFWMGPLSGASGKQATDNWGDFFGGNASGYLQSENPSNPNYCLHNGDLVALIDINHASNNNFIRQPIDSTNPLNIPAGNFFNRPDANNRRFYRDTALPQDNFFNTGTQQTNGSPWAGALTTGIFTSCNIPARSEPAQTQFWGRFNMTDPMQGDPVAENATGYLIRWTQWMLDVKKVDGFRIDAIKHMPSWFYDTFYDGVVYNRRQTPDGRWVIPYSFGESVEGNDFTFDRYIRMPNGRASGRNPAGDAFGNRDALDLNGAGRLRDLIGGGGLGSWSSNNVLNAHIDATDDGFNNGTIGVNHIFSHDNGSNGNGGSAPGVPTAKQQGWFAHAYLAMRPGVKKFYHNARGVNRSGGFWPRHGLLPVFGVEPNITQSRPSGLPISAPNSVITNLVQLNNMTGRGEFAPRWQDDDTFVFERRTNAGPGQVSSNVLVATNDRYDAGFDQRTVATNFPAGTRLIEYSGNATNATVDPNNDIFDVITVGPGGNVTLRIPRNTAPGTNAEHNRGFVVYAPALPGGTLEILNSNGSTPSVIPVDDITVPSWRRRANALPIITGNQFRLKLTTVNGDAGAGNNAAADDNAVFRINQGYQDFNGSGSWDVPFTNGVVPGYENFVTVRQPLADTANTNGLYEQVIDTTQLPEGYNYISVVAFRKRIGWEGPLFREFRQAIYVDRTPPQFTFTNPSPLPANTTTSRFAIKSQDRQTTRVHMIINPASLSNPLSLATAANLCTQDDRFDWSRTLGGLQNGQNTLLVIAFEDSGNATWQTYTVQVGNPAPTCDTIDFNNNGVFPEDQDVADFFDVLAGGAPATCDPVQGCNDIDFNNDGVFPDDQDIVDFFNVLAGGNC